MKYEVIKPYIDRETLITRNVGDIVDLEGNRATELAEYIKAVAEEPKKTAKKTAK